MEKVQWRVACRDSLCDVFVQLGSFLEELFAKAVVLNVHDSELCIYSSVSCSDREAGVNVDEVQLSTILSTMNVCRIFFHLLILRPLVLPVFRAWLH